MIKSSNRTATTKHPETFVSMFEAFNQFNVQIIVRGEVKRGFGFTTKAAAARKFNALRKELNAK